MKISTFDLDLNHSTSTIPEITAPKASSHSPYDLWSTECHECLDTVRVLRILFRSFSIGVVVFKNWALTVTSIHLLVQQLIKKPLYLAGMVV